MSAIQIRTNLQSSAKIHPQIRHCFVFLELFAKEGGIQSYIKDIFRAYPEGSTADIFLLRDAEDCENPYASEGLKFHYFKTQSLGFSRLKMAIALFKYLWVQRPTHVYCGHVNLAPLISLLCQSLGIPYTVMTYGKEVWEKLSIPTKLSLGKAQAIWTISRYTRDIACAVNNLNPDQIQILPCAVDHEYFTPGAKSPELLKRYGLDDAKVLVTVARLWSGDIYKGVDVTIRALPRILKNFPEVKYLVVGRGDDQPRLARLAEEMGVSDRVIFAGFVPTEELIQHYRLADAYIMPSQEGFGIVYLEAMACGIPVLSGDADGSADPLQDGKLGWRVPHRDPEAVSQACIEILTGKDQRCHGEWLREQAINYFGFPAFQNRLQQQLLEHQSSRSS
ncbi:glycosyltransferase family 4 protein [Calothrix sp. PCC 6303]|uniref:glycosyltransferase family 4 protein n=1 Tax=Calothrix sp. PCC 6303 TaxID=1170562 RepID=UPI0002A01306|nr:glycosyltransferase family 4 protein [Calothrix sp. PCC 6303]AFY99248.1 glycosyl transferase group 1 [Calothrix sp. PCC 6303]